MTREELQILVNKRPKTWLNDHAINVSSQASAIFFMFANWSATSVQLVNLITSLDTFPTISLFVYDIDDDEFPEFADANKLYTNGWGETFWVKNGVIVASLNKYGFDQLDDLILNNSYIV